MGFSKYPNEIDDSSTLPPSVDLVTPVKAEVVNRLRDATLAVQGELGTNPSGVFGDITARLLNVDSRLNAASVSASTVNAFPRYNNIFGQLADSPNGPFGLDNGFLGIGTATPDKELTVLGSGSFTESVIIGSADGTFGDLRVESGFQVVGLNNAGLNDMLLLATNSSDQLLMGNSFVTSVNIGASLLQFSTDVVTPLITQEDEAGAGISGELMTIHAQDSTGTGVKSGGSMLIRAGDAAGGTDTGGDLTLRPGLGDTNGQFFIHNGAGAITFRIDENDRIEFHATLVQFDSAEVAPTFSQEDEVGAGISGELMTVHAQDSTGTGVKSGGALRIRAGDASGGTDTGGVLTLEAGGGTSWGTVDIVDGGGTTRMQVTAGGVAGLGSGNVLSVTGSAITTSANALQFTLSATAPVIDHATSAVADDTGALLTIAAQDVTGSGTTITGGSMLIRAGDSSGGSAVNEHGGDLTLRPGTGGAGLGAAGELIFQQADGTPVVNMVGSALNITGTINIGAEPGTSGVINIPQGTTLSSRRAGVGDRNLIGLTASTVITVGDLLNTGIDIFASQTINLNIAGSTPELTVAATQITLNEPLFLAANGSHNVETLAATKTLTLADAHYQKLDPDAASRNVDLPAEASSDGMWYQISCVGADELVVRNDAAATIETLAEGSQALFICDGTDWISPGQFSLGGADVPIADNTADAFLVHQSTNDYIAVDTTNSSELMGFGNATTNPTYNFLGSGTIVLNGAAVTWDEAVDAPIISHTVVTGTGANVGEDLSVSAQPGQAQTGGAANNDGGAIVLTPGAPGTGGSGADGQVGGVTKDYPSIQQGARKVELVFQATTSGSGAVALFTITPPIISAVHDSMLIQYVAFANENSSADPDMGQYFGFEAYSYDTGGTLVKQTINATGAEKFWTRDRVGGGVDIEGTVSGTDIDVTGALGVSGNWNWTVFVTMWVTDHPVV